MNAFITLISSQDYLPAALVLNHSLKQVNSKYPLVVALTKDLATEENLNIFQQENIKVEIIIPLAYNQSTINYVNNHQWSHTVLNTASKINLFFLYQYDKLVYIDADVLVVKNIDNLFSYPNGSLLWWTEGMSGLFVFEPKKHDAKIYTTLLENGEFLDGNLIGSLFFVSKDNENYQISQDYMQNTFQLNDSKSIHYGLTKKPFLMTAIEAEEAVKKWPAYALYFYYLIPFKQKYTL